MSGPRLIRFVDDRVPAEVLAEAAGILRAGGIVAHPTETVYGLAADPWEPRAVARILSLKGRGEKEGLILIAAAVEEAEGLLAAGLPPEFGALARAFWPGPLTLVAPAGPGAPTTVVSAGGGLAVRVTSGETARRLIKAAGHPLTSTSANRGGELPARSGEEVARIFPEGVDLILDGGSTPGSLPSTVVDLTCRPLRILREGAVERHRIEQVIGGSWRPGGGPGFRGIE